MCKLSRTVTLLLALILSFLILPVQAYALVDIESYIFDSLEQVDTDLFPLEYFAGVSPISEFIDDSGNYYVAYDGNENFHIAILDKSTMRLNNTITIDKPYPLLGGVIMDENGYYYALFGQADNTNNGESITISIIQYNDKGIKINELAFKGKDTSIWKNSSGTRIPFEAGNASMAINDDILVISYAREMYNGHQSNYVLFIKIPSLTRITDYPIPYTSHSFDQRVFITSSKDFLFVDHGDAYPRGFHVQKVKKDSNNSSETYSYVPFHFREGSNRPYGYNLTFAKLGGIGEISTGYVLAGVSENTLSLHTAPTTEYYGHNEAGNVFVQIFRKDYEMYPEDDIQLIDAPIREAIGERNDNTETEMWLEPGTKDYGVKWITDYNENEFADNVKVISTREDQIVIMWEKFKLYNTPGIPEYLATYFTILNNKCETVMEPTKLPDIRLTAYEQPVYDGKYVYWTTGNKKGKQLITHRLNVSPLTEDDINRIKSNEVISLIDAISEDKETFGVDIERARAAYDRLNNKQKKLVTNYDKLIAAETRYEEITAPVLFSVNAVFNRILAVIGINLPNIKAGFFADKQQMGSRAAYSDINVKSLNEQADNSKLSISAFDGNAALSTSNNIKVMIRLR